MASGNAPSILFDALTGASTLIDAGEGTRQKAWLDEVPRWLKEAAEPLPLAGLALGRLVNYPAFIEGDRELKSNPIGGDTNPADPFNGVEISEVIRNTVEASTGDGSVVAFGNEAASVPDPGDLNFGRGGSDTGQPVPRGASLPAFVTSEDGSGNFNLSATDGLLTIEINGVQYVVNVGTNAATTPEGVADSIRLAGVAVAVVEPVDATGLDGLRLLSLGGGAAQLMRIVAGAGSAGAVIFATIGNTFVRGANGPMNDTRNLESGGQRPQRRVLPGSVSIAATIGSVQVVVTDDKVGGLDDGTGTHTGTVDYATGVWSLTYGTAPDNATPVVQSQKALIPLLLSDPVRIPPGGKEFALLLK